MSPFRADDNFRPIATCQDVDALELVQGDAFEAPNIKLNHETHRVWRNTKSGLPILDVAASASQVNFTDEEKLAVHQQKWATTDCRGRRVASKLQGVYLLCYLLTALAASSIESEKYMLCSSGSSV